MTLKIKSVSLDDFRGYKHLDIEDIEDLTIIVGPNAVGKTNIIEALQLLTAGVSFKRSSLADTISWNRDSAHLRALMEEKKRSIEHEIIIRENEKIYEINGKKKTLASFRGNLPCILFIPDDLQLIKSSSAKRRDAIDSLAIQLSKQYSTLKANYQQTLRQRNLLIKQGIYEGPLFDSWNESIAAHGSRLTLSRYRLFSRLSAYMKRAYAQIAPDEKLDTSYIPSWERFDEEERQIGDSAEYIEKNLLSELNVENIEEKLLTAFLRLKEMEIRRSTTLIGPHKDEIAFFINRRNARLFASQGQQRTIVLSLKIAAVQLVKEIMGTEPVLLLDDVMSELDENHRNSLTSFVKENAQTFITTTNLGYFSKDFIDTAKILRVPIEGTRYEY